MMNSMNRLIAATALCLAVLLSPVASQPCRAQRFVPAKVQESALVEAVAQYNEGRYREAVTILKSILDANPANDAAHYYLALCETFLGQASDAASHLKEAARLDPSNYWYRDRLARLYVAIQEPELAIETYESLIRDYPKNTDIYYTLVQLYMQLGDTERILSTLDEIETVTGKDEMVTLTRYDILMKQQKYEEAYKMLEEYNDSFSSPRILSAMGDWNIAHFRDSLALDNYTEALSYDSGSPQALLGVSEVYRFRSDYPNYFAAVNAFVKGEEVPLESKARYLESLFRHTDAQFLRNFKPNLDLLVEEFTALAPTDTLVAATVIPYYYNTGEGPKASAMARECSEANPSSLAMRGLYVQLLSLISDWDGLLGEAERAYTDFPSEIGFLEMKTVAEYQLKDYDALIADSERMIAAAPRDTAVLLRAYTGIGDVYHLKGDSRKSFAAYEKALKLDPANCPVLNNYAYYLALEGKKLKKAYTMSKVTIEKEPDNATYLDTFGWILFLQGKAVEAKPFFKHAMLYGGKESAAVLYHYGEVLYALGEYDLARVYWNLAKAKNTDGAVPDLDEIVSARLDKISK